MKSLSDLNTKWWYRLIKVLYCCIFLIIAFVSVIVVYNITKSYIAKQWQINCLYGNHSKLTAMDVKNQGTFVTPSENFSINDTYLNWETLPNSADEQIQSACDITQDDINTAKTKAADETAKMHSSIYCSPDTIGISSLICDGSYAPKTYQISETQISIKTPLKIIALILAFDLLIMFLAFEIIRRLFYYITLGKIRPPK